MHAAREAPTRTRSGGKAGNPEGGERERRRLGLQRGEELSAELFGGLGDEVAWRKGITGGTRSSSFMSAQETIEARSPPQTLAPSSHNSDRSESKSDLNKVLSDTHTAHPPPDQAPSTPDKAHAPGEESFPGSTSAPEYLMSLQDDKSRTSSLRKLLGRLTTSRTPGTPTPPSPEGSRLKFAPLLGRAKSVSDPGVSGQTDWYEGIEAFHHFEQICADKWFHRAPNDWWIVISDVENSTSAVERGQYREVNTCGAATISVAAQRMGGCKFPSIFGGDGATLLIPDACLNSVLDGLRGLQTLSRRTLGLELRVGRVQVSEVRARGYDVCVAKHELNGTGRFIAMVRGGG
mmetsp:Transcript_8472/g.21125  ORF Transcript_8472/g.21125 Transcript_8472/m.21125 type:complete len:348 (+) Transcript_8472:30-1073(+)